MTKLFLTSKFATVGDGLLEFLPSSPKNLKVAFIDTAAQPYKEKPWLYEDRDKLVSMGFQVMDVDINGKTEADLKPVLDPVDIIFVAGGSTNYLLKQSQESGFGKLVKEYVRQGKIYVGSSAGSILAGPSTEPYWESEQEDLPPYFIMNDFSALNLVDFVTLPHYNKPVYEAEFKTKLIPKYENKFKFKILRDNEAIMLKDDKIIEIKE